MDITVIGAKGMLGTDLLAAAASAGHAVSGLDLPELDITDPASVERVLPVCDLVINTAAFTRVDDAEKEREAAWAINAEGAGHVARVCAAKGIRLFHISTDYVFDGSRGSAYAEDDPVHPVSEYGRSKLGGEESVRAAGGTSLIIRTQSLYGHNGRNFIKAILNQIRKGKKELTVVVDQVSSPTYTRDLADAIMDLAGTDAEGIVHAAASGFCSWFDFAREIVRCTGAEVEVKPMSAADLKFPAPRPPYSVLDTSRLKNLTGRSLRSWQDGLNDYLQHEPLANQ